MSKTSPSFTERVSAISASDLADRASSVAGNAAEFDPIELAHRLGFRSRHAYIAGFASVLLAVGSWKASRRRSTDSKSQSDRWGIFVGLWAPTFFAIGLALSTKEDD